MTTTANIISRLAQVGAVIVLVALTSMSVSAKDEPIVGDMDHGDFGNYPSDYQALIKDWAQTSLKDPDSAKYLRFSKPRKEWVVADLKPVYGWSTCTTINSKNSYGAYVGAQIYWFFIKDGKILRAQNTEENLGPLPIPGTTISRNHSVNCDDGPDPPKSQ